VSLDQTVKDLGNRRDETMRVRAESERAEKFFGDLVRDSDGQRNVVDGMDLDAPPQGAMQ
jgi:mitofusin